MHLVVNSARSKLILLAALMAVLIWSAVNPYEYFTWFLEVVPVLVAIPILLATHRRFEFTMLVYILIWIHAVILMIGGHYTYARVPLFDWIRDAFDLTRNHYDRIGHFAQGFVPSLVAREILIRQTPLRRGPWLFFLVACVALAISAAYELVEWAVAVASGSGADDFLGTQGDLWDTQTDMFLALVGSLIAQWTLARWHDRQLKSRTTPDTLHPGR